MFKEFMIVLCALIASVFVGVAMAAESDEPLIVFAAASLTDALQKASDEYTRSSGQVVKLSFAASSALARQIESGAKADVFLSADQEWMDYLEQRQQIATATRVDLLGNRLVLIAPSTSKVSFKLEPGAPLVEALGSQGRLATGDPESVPVGRYAQAALTNLRLWAAVAPKLVRADNVRVALLYVARGEAPLGIVYATDAAAEPKVRVVDTFSQSLHPPISYPVAATRTAKPQSKAFIAFLSGNVARSIFEQAGFSLSGNAVKAAQDGCAGFKFDVSRELRLLGAKSEPFSAAVASPSAAAVTEGRAYRLALKPQGNVRFAAKPEKSTMNEGSHAGLVSVTPAKTGLLTVSLSQAAWIDVLANAKPKTSTDHSGSQTCSTLRKAVKFEVTKGEPLILQISGSTESSVGLLVTQ